MPHYIIEALTGVGADDLNVRNSGQNHLQVSDFDFNIGSG